MLSNALKSGDVSPKKEDVSLMVDEDTKMEFVMDTDGRIHVIEERREVEDFSDAELATLESFNILNTGEPGEVLEDIGSDLGNHSQKAAPCLLGIRPSESGWSYTVDNQIVIEHLMMNLLASDDGMPITIYNIYPAYTSDVLGAISRSTKEVTVVLSSVDTLEILDVFETKATVIVPTTMSVVKPPRRNGGSDKSLDSWIEAEKKRAALLVNKFIDKGYLAAGSLTDVMDGKYVSVNIEALKK